MKHRGFTLIELLVVIAMVALLVAILTVVLHGVRQHAKVVVCSSNIKALTTGLITYRDRNDASFPYGFYFTIKKPPSGPIGDAFLDGMGRWWPNFLEGYVNKSKGQTTVFNCPSKKLYDPRLKENILYGNYGVNMSICKSSRGDPGKKEFIGAPLGDMDIPQPSRTLLIVDSGYCIISWWHATDVPPVALKSSEIEDTAYVPGLKINKDKNLMPGQEDDAINGRHPNKTVNVGFVGGHVERKKADDLFVEKNGDEYTNKIPLWSPK